MRRGQRRHQRAAGVEYIVGEWCPELVGKVRGYPRTQETYEAQRARLNANREQARAAGRLTRHGVPNGWAGRKAEIAEIGRNSRDAAERLMDRMAARRDFVPDNQQSALCLTTALEIALNQTYRTSARIAAMRLVLQYTQGLPTTRPVRRTDAEGWLQKLVDAAETTDSEKMQLRGGRLVERKTAIDAPRAGPARH